MADSSAMEQFPSLPTETTHRVKVNSRLALRESPAYSGSSNSANKDNHIKGPIVDMLPNNTNLIVVDEGVGHKCEWAQVLVVGKNYPKKKLFVKKIGGSKDFIVPVEGIAESAPYECGEKAVGNPSAIPIVDWVSKMPFEVMFDEQSAEYKVCVEMSEAEYVSTGGEAIMSRLEEATILGLEYILKHVGKRSDDSYISELMGKQYFQFVRAKEYFVDTKAHSYLKVLVTLPHRYVPPLEDKPDVKSVDSGRTLVAWDAMESVRLRSVYKTHEFKPALEKAAKLFEEYAKDIDNYNGTIVDYDARTEADRLRQTAKEIEILFKDNDISHDPFSKKELLEIGWDEKLIPVFIGLTLESGGTIAMASGMDKFIDAPPIDSQRTQGYLWQLNLISTLKRSDNPWTEFVTSFTYPDPPAIIPGAKSEDSPADISKNESLAAKEAETTDAMAIKTYAEKLSEDRILSDMKLKLDLYEDRMNSFDFVGSSVASCEGLQKTLDKINTIDDAFGEVLDKISIADLIKQCMDAITPELATFGEVGLGDIPDVGVDYEFSMPNIPDIDTDFNMPDLGDMTISSLEIGSVSFGDLNLSGMSIGDLDIGDIDFGSLGLGDLNIGELNIGSFTLGSLNLSNFNFLNFNLGSIDIGDIDFDFGDITVGELNLDISSFTVAMLGISDLRLGKLGLELNIGDLGFTIGGLTMPELGLPDYDITALGLDLDGIELGDLTFGELELGSLSMGRFPDFGFDLPSFKVADLDLPSLGRISDFPDLDLSMLTLGSFPNIGSFSLSSLGLDGFSLGDLNLTGFSIGDLNLDGISLDSLGLGSLSLDSLGLSGYDLAGLKDKFEELGLSGITDMMESYGLDKLSDPMGTVDDITGGLIGEGEALLDDASEILNDPAAALSSEFSDELKMANEKLSDLVGDKALSENPFEQGVPAKIPSLAITLPDNLPTEDIMASMGDAIEEALTTFLSELFVAMVKQVLQTMIDSCGQEPEQAGKENLNEMLDESPNVSGSGDSDPLGGLMAATGVGMGDDGPAPIGYNPPPAAMRKQMNDMLDDVSLVFTPMELCSLINGKASKKVILLARNLISKRYPDLNLNTRSKVADFFRAFGNLIDPSICLVIEEPAATAQSPILGDVLCASDEMNGLRRNMLRNKGDDITDEQIENQLKKARQRKVNAAKLLADMVNKGPLSDNYEPPPVVCQKGTGSPSSSTPANGQATQTPNSNTQGGLVDLSHESIDFAVDKTMDCLFVPLQIAFSNDMKSYPAAFTAATEDEVEQSVETWLDAGQNLLNPVLVPKYGDANGAKGAGVGANVSIKMRVKKAMPALHQALRQMETNDSLVFQSWDGEDALFEPVNKEGIDDSFSFENGGYGIKLVLPKPSLGDLSSIKDSLPEELNAMAATIDAALENASPSISMYYILAKIDENDHDENNNHFLTIVTEKKNVIQKDGTVVPTDVIIYRKLSDTEPSEEVQAVLDEIKLDGAVSVESAATPKYKFAAMAYNKWAEIGVTDQDLFGALVSESWSSSQNSAYSELTRDIMTYLSQRIANGVYFQNYAPENPSSGEAAISSSTPIIEFLDLDPDPTAAQQLAGVDVHMLGLEHKKKCAKQNIKNSGCVDLNRPTDGSPAEELSDPEKEMMKICIESIFRVYMVDHYLRSIFSNTVFKMPSEPDEAYLRHVSSYILADLKSYDMPNYVNTGTDEVPILKAVTEWGTYEEDFIEQVVSMYEPEEGTEPDEEADESDIEGQYTTTLAFEQQIKKQYPAVIQQMEALIVSRNVDSLENQFLNNYLKTFDIADFGKFGSKFFTGGSSDWSESIQGAAAFEWDGAGNNVKVFSSLATLEAEVKNSSHLSNAAAFENQNVDTTTIEAESLDLSQQIVGGSESSTVDLSGIKTANINYENGNFYLEKYIEVEDHADRPDWWEGMMSGTFVNNTRWVGDNWGLIESATSPEHYKYFGVMSESDFNTLLDGGLPAGTTLQGSDHDNMPVFKSVHRGWRLMYLPPTSESGEFFPVVMTENVSSQKFERFEPSAKDLFDKAWATSLEQDRWASKDPFHAAANSIGENVWIHAIKKKAYKIIEEIDSTGYLAIGTQGLDNAQTLQSAARIYLFKETNPFPIIDVKETYTSMVATTQGNAWNRISSSPEYKALTEYMFPISRFQSLLAMYCFNSTSMKPEILTGTCDSKDKLRTIFFALNSKGGYKHNNPALDAIGGEAGLSKMIQNEFGAQDMPASDNSWNYNMPLGWGKQAKGVGFETVAKATTEAVKKIFKKQVEKSDPNISMAHKLAMVSKMAGLNIPTLAWSFLILPVNVFVTTPGPPLTPLGMMYHAMGLGLWKRTKGANKEDDEALEKMGFGSGEASPYDGIDDCDGDE